MNDRLLRYIAASILLLVPALAQAQIFLCAGSPNYVSEYGFEGTLLNGNIFNAVVTDDLAVDQAGTIYQVYSYHSSPYYAIVKYFTNGTRSFLYSTATSQMLSSMALDQNGNMFVANSPAGTILLYDNFGTLLNSALISGLTNPAVIRMNPVGHLLILHSGTVAEYAQNGSLVNPSVISGYATAWKMELDASGNIYLSNFVESGPGTVSKFGPDGTLINAAFITVNEPSCLGVLPNGHLLVATYYPGSVGEFNSVSGAVINASFLTGTYFARAMAILTPLPPARPLLEINLTGTNTVLLTWPSPSTGFFLQQNSNLSSNGWADVGATVSDDGTNRSVEVLRAEAGFFRLRHP